MHEGSNDGVTIYIEIILGEIVFEIKISPVLFSVCMGETREKYMTGHES